LVEDLKNTISRLQRSLEEKKRQIENMREENKKFVDHYRKVADDKNKSFREEKLSLEKQIKKHTENLLYVEKEMGELTRKKGDLENEVVLKSNDIRKRDKMIVEKEREMSDAIEKSNSLRLEIDTLQQQYREAMVEDKEMSEKIETLKDELAEKEITIMDLRKNQTMKREDVEEEMGKITKVLSDKIDTLMRSFVEKK
jgi:chromosome segregation ATPase